MREYAGVVEEFLLVDIGVRHILQADEEELQHLALRRSQKVRQRLHGPLPLLTLSATTIPGMNGTVGSRSPQFLSGTTALEPRLPVRPGQKRDAA